MLVTALSPVIGYDKASKIAHYAMEQRSHSKDRRSKAGLCDGGRVRPHRRSGEDGATPRGKSQLEQFVVTNDIANAKEGLS